MAKKRISIQNIKPTNYSFGVLSVLLLIIGLFVFISYPHTEIKTNSTDEKNINVQNKHGLNITVSADIIKHPRGLAFVAHGFGGNKEDNNILSLSKTFNNHEYSTIRFDATNSNGQSDGDLAYANPSSYRDDLFDIITWAKTQDWYQEPFYLCGYSLGALSSITYAESHPTEVKGLITISPLVAGYLHITDVYERDIEDWKQVIQQLNKLYHRDIDNINLLKWFPIILDLMRFDLTQSADKLTMPVLIIVGQEDMLAPLEHQQKLSKAINGNVELVVIKGGDHFFDSEERIENLTKIIDGWLTIH